jgi:hypothetical protein
MGGRMPNVLKHKFIGGSHGQLLYRDTSASDGVSWGDAPAFRPEHYPGSDLAAKINACVAAMPPSGGVIDARSFTGAHAWSTKATISKPVQLLLGNATFTVSASIAIEVTGTASLDIAGETMWGTVFQAGTASLKVVNFIADGHLTVSHLIATNGGMTQTSGYLIKLTPPVGTGHHCIRSCASDGLWDVIDVGKANAVLIDHCNFVNCVNAEITGSYFGADAFDAGTTFVTNCVLGSNTMGATYGILWGDSSGLYVQNCHIIGHGIGIAAYATEDHVYNEICVYQSRIGLQGMAGVVIKRASGSGGFAQCHISDNLIGSPANDYVAIQLGASGGTNDISYSAVVNNRLSSGGGTGVTLLAINHGNDLYVAGNVFVTADPANAAIGIPGTPVDVRVGRNKYVGFTAHQTVTAPPISGVVYEPEIRPVMVSIDPPNITAGVVLTATGTITGLRPAHGDRIHLERPAGLNPNYVIAGLAATSADTVTVWFYGAGNQNDGAMTFCGTWVDIVP